MTTLAFVLQSPDVTPTWLSRVAAAIAVQLARDVAPMWLLGWPEVDTRVYERIPDAPRGSLPIVLLADADVAGTFGYHDATAEGVPYARVFTRGQTLDGVSQTASHEALEALVDPSANRWVDGPEGLAYALDAADPVEGEGYRIDVGGASIQVADFVLPAWFEPATPADEPTDLLGRLRGPFRLAKAGYAIRRAPDGLLDTTPPEAARSPAQRHPASRMARRQRRLP